MRKPLFYYRFSFSKNKTESGGKIGVIEISIEKPTKGNWKPYYFRGYPSNDAGSQRIRRKNHKILDSLLKKENIIGTNVEIILEKEYRAGFGFEEGNSIGSRGFSFGATEFDPAPIYNPVFHPDNKILPCTTNRFIEGIITYFDFVQLDIPIWLLLKYEKGKYIQLTSDYIKNIKVLK